MTSAYLTLLYTDSNQLVKETIWYELGSNDFVYKHAVICYFISARVYNLPDLYEADLYEADLS